MECLMLLEGAVPVTTFKCACPVLTALLHAFQAGLDEQAAVGLSTYVAKLAGTKAPAEQEHARAIISVEHSVRAFLPRAFATVPGLDHLANELSALPALSDDTHDAYVHAVESLTRVIRVHVTKDPLARGAAVLKATYQIQYLLEQYRVRPYLLSAQVIASAFSRVKGDASAALLLDELFTRT